MRHPLLNSDHTTLRGLAIAQHSIPLSPNRSTLQGRLVCVAALQLPWIPLFALRHGRCGTPRHRRPPPTFILPRILGAPLEFVNHLGCLLGSLLGL